MHLGEHDITVLPPWKRNAGLVFQSYALFPHMTVAENVAFGLEMRKIPKAQMAPKITEALRLVRLDHLGDRLPRQLSGGQQQRVALARALVFRPDVLLLDEPLSNLDAKLRQDVRVEIRELQRKLGLTTVMVTHDQEEALTMADRLVVMNEGSNPADRVAAGSLRTPFGKIRRRISSAAPRSSMAAWTVPGVSSPPEASSSPAREPGPAAPLSHCGPNVWRW